MPAGSRGQREMEKLGIAKHWQPQLLNPTIRQPSHIKHWQLQLLNPAIRQPSHGSTLTHVLVTPELEVR